MKGFNIKSETKQGICFISIFLLFITTRLMRLDKVPFGPHGLHIDELGAAYDSFCISEYGVDQYLYKFPVYFKCFGEGQNALYTYLAAIVFKIGGVSIFNFRLVAVICAVLAFIAMFFLVKEMIDVRYALIALFLMTTMPAFMMSEHWGLECYLFLSLSIISMFFLIKGIVSGKMVCYLLSGVFWGITLYTYAITYIVVPPFLVLCLVYLVYIKRINPRQSLATGLPVIILGVPLLIQQLVMMDYIKPFEFMGIIDFWHPDFYRYSSISVSYVPYNLLHSSWLILVTDGIPYNSNSTFGTIYYISVPFMLIGLYMAVISGVRSIKDKALNLWFVVLVFYLVARFAILFVEEPNTNRANVLFFPYLLFTVLGIKHIVEKVNRKWINIIIALAYLLSFLCFSYWFYSYSGYRLASDVKGGMKVDTQCGEVLGYAREIANGKKICAIINEGWCTDLSMALFTETSPYDYSNDNDMENDTYNGVEWVLPETLDLSGDTIYVVDNALHHITDYMITEGFSADYTYDEFTVVSYDTD